MAWAAVAVGPVAVLSDKALVPLLVVCGLAGLAQFLRKGEHRPALPRAPLVLSGLLALWAGVSATWAPDPWGAFFLTCRVWLLCLAGSVLLGAVHSLAEDERRRIGRHLVAGLILAMGIFLIGAAYAFLANDALWGSYSKDPRSTLNNGAVVLGILFWPTASFLWAWGHRRTAVALFFALILLVSPIGSIAAVASLAAGAVVALAVAWRGWPVRWIIGLAAVALVALMPVLSETLLAPDGPLSGVDGIPSSIHHRQFIWDYAAQQITTHPWLGWGMDASRHLGQGRSVMGGFLELMPLHPHNIPLQMRLELGLPGMAFGALWIGLIFLGNGGRRERARLPDLARCAAAAGFLVVGSASYGAWQNWWIATLWLVTAFIAALPADRTETGPQAIQ